MNLAIKLATAFAMGAVGTKIAEMSYNMYKEIEENQRENGSESNAYNQKIDEIVEEENKRHEEMEQEFKRAKITMKINKMSVKILKSIPELKLDPENKEMVKKYSETVKGLKEIKEEIAALECVEENVEVAEKLRAKADTLIEAYTREFDKADEAK
jgi:hypothetical protein